jgi:hypothetical protein
MRRQQVGFNQRIQLDWLERTASSFLAGNGRSVIQSDLEDTFVTSSLLEESLNQAIVEKRLQFFLKYGSLYLST